MTTRSTTWQEPSLSDAARREFGRRFRVFGGVFLLFLIEPLISLWQDDTIPVRLLGLVLLVAYGWLFLFAAPRATFGGPGRVAVATVGSMTAIIGVYLVVCGAGGLSLLPYLVVVVGMLVPVGVGAVVVVAVAAAGTWLPTHVVSWNIDSPLWGVGAGVIIAGTVALLMRYTAGTRGELDLAREEIAELGAEQERLRIARDLHDLLGHALTTVTVKAELASRLVEVDPAGAAAEMREVAALSRNSLSEVRATVAGYREMSLAAELVTARQILDAAGIEADLPASTEGVPGDLRELFGWTLREGVTNAVRHSRARHVEIRFEPAAIEVVNDGVAPPDGSASGRPNPGSGLAGLSERATHLGAHLLAGPEAPDRYRLRVELTS